MKVLYDNHWVKNTRWRRSGKLRHGFAFGPFIILLKDR